MPVATPSHLVDDEPPPAPCPTGGHDPGITTPDRDPAQLLSKLLASATLGCPTAGDDPAGVAPPDPDDDLTHQLVTEALASATLAGDNKRVAQPAASDDASSASPGLLPIRARRCSRAFRVPTDYLRAGQESRDRRRRRAIARRCLRELCEVRKDRAAERGLSAMMARLTTTTSASASGDAADAPSSDSEHGAALGEMLQKMEMVVSIKD